MHFGHARVHHLRQLLRRELGVGFQQDLAGVGVNHIGGNECAFQIAKVNFDLGDAVLLDFLQHRGRHLAAGVDNLFAALGRNAVRQLHADQVGRTVDAGSSVQYSFLSCRAMRSTV